MSTEWYVYMVKTAKGALYTGITTDVARRFAEHQVGTPKGAKSLRGKGPLELVYRSPAGNRSQASRIEWRIKQWPRVRKLALARGEINVPDDP